ncbi:MAG TPA: hypothetical protein VN325_23175 [Steroidobacteraceae bacterium]|nr:hypothetical protein [Steroidobacteraceae bacterium]
MADRTVEISDKVLDENIAGWLRDIATMILRADGDRDYMNPSDLTVQQTMAAADLIRIAADRLSKRGG